ncbi:MAG TPA: hypothetical protein VGM82_00255 [Gemmatimonadaceae bacterium]
MPRALNCNAEGRGRLAELVRALPSDTTPARLADMVTSTEYPDQRILDAALAVASDAAATRAARIAALQIVVKQVYGFSSEITGFSATGNVVQMKPYADAFDRCSIIGLNDLTAYRPPDPPVSALTLARSRLALTATASEHDPAVRVVARCVIGK